MDLPEFQKFNKIARLSRDIVITEKLDGSNICLCINENNELFVGSRNHWLDGNSDNFGSWHWAMDNKEALLRLGQGYHYGEWIGKGIQRNYGLDERRVYLFNVNKWCMWNEEPKVISINPKTGEEKKQEKAPKCCYVVPVLYQGIFCEGAIDSCIKMLDQQGSRAISGFKPAEGVVIFHKASGTLFKKTIENDEKPKG